MPALVLIFPLIAMCWDQGFYPHKHPAPAAAEVVRWITLQRPYPEIMTFIEVRQ